MESTFTEPPHDAVTQALRTEFKEAFRMFADAVARLDDTAWGEGEPTWTEVPARISMHILLTAEFYVSKDRDATDWEPGGLRYWDSPIDALPDRAATLAEIERVATLVDTYLVENGDDGLRGGKAETAGEGQSRVAWMVYALRHLQHHVGQLSAQCKIRGFGAAPWEVDDED
ncbi:MAG: hypothetical protein AAGD32_05700 [Planctomycetota bacterium]